MEIEPRTQEPRILHGTYTKGARVETEAIRKLRVWRLRVGMTWTAIGEACGMSRQKVMEWDYRHARPRRAVRKILETLTKGEVQELDWLTPDEVTREIARIERERQRADNRRRVVTTRSRTRSAEQEKANRQLARRIARTDELERELNEQAQTLEDRLRIERELVERQRALTERARELASRRAAVADELEALRAEKKRLRDEQASLVTPRATASRLPDLLETDFDAEE